jgi:hypothetical protein
MEVRHMKRKSTQKKSYRKPKLTVHGSLKQLTRGEEDGTQRETVFTSLRTHS